MMDIYFSKISKEISSNDTIDIRKPLFENLIKCSFIQIVEFNAGLKNINDNFFYFMQPLLRGFAEDIIVFNYINTVIEEQDRNDFIGYFMLNDVIKSVEKQNIFFQRVRDHQPRITKNILKQIYTKNYFKAKFETFKDKYNWKRNKPSIWKMATDGDLEEFYNYFYYASSRLVHFNPHLLLKMGIHATTTRHFVTINCTLKRTLVHSSGIN